MSNNNNYIKLPSLRSIEVKNYSLFKKSWSYKIKDGLNLFLGINGLGKTTTANMIIYGLVGIYEEITPKYFKSRKHANEGNAPTVALNFKVGDEDLYVQRNLFSPQIVSFKIGTEEYTKQNTSDINNAYIEKLLELTGVTDLDDLSFLLRYLIIREEEGNFLLWDQEAHSRAIRLLLNYPKFDSEFRQLSEKVRNADSEVRDTQYFLSQLKEDLNTVGNLRNKKLENIREYKSINKIQSAISEAEDNIRRLREKKNEILKNLSYLTDSLNKLETEDEGLAAEADYLNDEVNELEGKMFESIYSSPKVALASHKLMNYRICMFCDNEIPRIDAHRISDIIEQKNHCPVCDSHIKRTTSQKPPSAKSIHELEQLRERIRSIDERRKNFSDNITGLRTDYDSSWEKFHNIESELKKALLNNEDLKIRKASLEEGKEDLTISYDRDIDAYEASINKHEKVIAKAKRKGSKYQNSLESKNSELNDLISSFSYQLNEIFNKYASKYFRGDCVLAPVVGRKSKESRAKLTTFIPKFGGQERRTIDSVSTSERILIETLFRLSILELYYLNTSNAPFIVLETSEGTFDVFMTRKFAEALTAFVAGNKFPFISITNLSKPDFVKTLISKYDKPENRILKFSDFCCFTKEQEENLQELLNTQKKIF